MTDPTGTINREENKEHIEEKIENKKRTSRNYQLLIWVALVGTLISLVVLIVIASSPQAQFPFLLYSLVLFSLLIFLAMFSWREKKGVDEVLVNLQFDKEMLALNYTDLEIRAEKLFRRNQHDLEKYYALNLNHNRRIFMVGIVCMIASLIIIATSFWILVEGPEIKGNTDIVAWTKGFIAFIGAVGTITVNVVAAIYLQMHGKAVDTLTQFHQRLVVTSQLFLANAFASRISESANREKLLSELATEIVKKA